MEMNNQNSIKGLQIVAIDHGNKQVKGEYGYKYESGYSESSIIPATSSNLLKYEGRYFSVGQNRFNIMDNKALDEKFLILTLPTIANTLNNLELKRADICLAAGLPIINFSRLKDSFRNSLMKERLQFEYVNIFYDVTIKEVFIFPQCISGAITKLKDYQNMTVILVDIGGGTIDYTIMEKGVPNIQKTGSQNMGIIHLFNEIKQEILTTKGIMIEESQIEDIILNNYNPLFLDENIVNIVIGRTKKYVDSLIWKLREENFETKANPVVFLGGGAQLLKNYFPANKNLSYFEVLSEFANVEGFKLLAKQKLNTMGR